MLEAYSESTESQEPQIFNYLTGTEYYVTADLTIGGLNA